MPNENVQAGFIQPIAADKLRIGHQANAAAVALKDVRCGKCQKLLFRGDMRGEIKCPRCGKMNRWG